MTYGTVTLHITYQYSATAEKKVLCLLLVLTSVFLSLEYLELSSQVAWVVAGTRSEKQFMTLYSK